MRRLAWNSMRVGSGLTAASLRYRSHQLLRTTCLTVGKQNTLPHRVTNNLQQYRNYSTPAATTECWNCKKFTEKQEQMICVGCGHLQDLQSDINYFALLGFPVSFSLDQQALTKRYRQLQTLVHPDKYSNKSQREQSNSSDWSSLLNKAYKTLSVPFDRGQYLLRLQGLDLPKGNSSLNKEFLMEMMERNEEVDDADSSVQLDQLKEQIVQELGDIVIELGELFDDNNLDEAKTSLVQMKYLLSIQTTIKKKQQLLMGTVS